MGNLLEVVDVTKKYGSNTALNHVSLNLKSGQIVGLLGPNGSGKSTLIKILTGMNTNYKGKVLIDGKEVGAGTKAIVSYLSDCPCFASWMKVGDALNLYRDMFADFDYERAVSILERFDIGRKMNIKSMSKGTQEKLQLALVMSRRAKLVVLDEPIGGVDPAARDVIMETILKNYDAEQTILLATHLIQDIEKIFDSVIFIKNGEIILNEEVETLRCRHQKSIVDLFKEEFKC